ncbi:MAG: glutamate--cysteine ligase [Nocardioides sp.]|uniref:carboxylate-amine ligase n=1 Tax=Nocardioides sp. TaxID=35761 RepID=UPI0039E68B83
MPGRTVGVEEEMLLVDPHTRRPVPSSDQVVDEDGAEHELFLEQVETQSDPHHAIAEVRRDLTRSRLVAAEAARAAGTRLAAMPTPIIPAADWHITPKLRYRLMLARFGEVGRRALVCGTHVHVQIRDDDEGVAVLDRLRPWLPLVLALSANSPFGLGVDTGYASWRSQVWESWPSAGPTEPFGDAATYRRAVTDLIDSGAAMDPGMIYFDARLSSSYPTVEVRVCDVCTDLDDTMVIAAVVRALVETCAEAWRLREPACDWRVELLRAARWRARRDGLGDRLIDPLTGRLVPATEALGTLLERIGPALRDAGDDGLVERGLRRLHRHGTGAARQRLMAGPDHDLRAVVDDMIARTSPAPTARR